MKLMHLGRSGPYSVQHAYQCGSCVDFVWPIRASFCPVKYVLMLFPLLAVGADFVKNTAKSTC
jgi:hypothetical protein